MSLILDALRRADSERERGAVPGLHAQPVPMASPERPAGGRRGPWVWLAAAAGTGLLAALVWIAVGREAMRQPAASARAPLSLPSAPAPQSSATVETPRAAAPSAPLPQPAEAASGTSGAAQAGTAEPRAVAEPAPWPATEGERKVTTPAAAATPPPSAPGVAPADTPLATREQLPESIRSQLPPLAIGGSIYSPNPGDRSVIIDGRLLRENDRLSADLAVEQIRPKSAVLRFKSYRFEVAF